jgi:hypothetical protein
LCSSFISKHVRLAMSQMRIVLSFQIQKKQRFNNFIIFLFKKKINI